MGRELAPDVKQSVRYHSLDALRAWAMLLGIVLHAAWFMTSRNLLAPMTDVDGGRLYDFILQFIHIFRLQVFFVMAGFFAHLVLDRRGTRKFIGHRTARIALPLLAAWIVLYPVMMLQYARAGLQTGQILTDQGVGPAFRDRFAADLAINPTNLLHLWFLYYLLVIYALVLSARFMMRKVLDRREAIRGKLDRIFCWTAESPWGIVVLAVCSTVPLYFEPLWNGLGGFVFFFIPSPAGLVGYLIFFTFGWFLFRHPELLDTMAGNWRRNLFAGTVIAIPVFAITVHADKHSTPLYPFLMENQIGDHQELVAAADSTGNEPRLQAQRRVWEFLPEERRQFLREHSTLTTDQRAGLAMELSLGLIYRPGFSDPRFWQKVDLPEELATQVTQRGPPANAFTTATLNRRLLEYAFPDMIATDFMDRPYAPPLKLLFSVGYSLSMWMLVFGLIGIFSRYYNSDSPGSRYIADSAYWIYLIHLPVMMYFETLVGTQRWGWGGVPKFLFYVTTATILCFVSYHYLVRSTLIGRFLNGRRYPFVAVPWKSKT